MRTCERCGRPAADQFRFCGYCGQPLPTPEQPGSAGPLGGGRRDVTVIFVDITNFTAASRILDSELVFAWIDDTMRKLAAVVDRFEGTIDKFTGDGLMALFGVPEAHENDPERAVLAGLAMQETIQALRVQVARDYGIDFRARIGINSGTVVAGGLGGERHWAYTVLGDTVNVASRLEKAAEPGTVLVSASTFARTAPLFEYEPMPPILVKGVPEPLQTYRPRRSVVRPGPLRGLPGLAAPLVGRRPELERLQRLLATVGAGDSPVALVSGEAGLGKSRLTDELRRSLDGAVRWIGGSCQAHTRLSPLWLIADLLRDLLELPQAGGPEAQRAQIASMLQAFGLPGDELLPYLIHAVGLPAQAEEQALLDALEPAMLQRQLHTAIRLLILAAAERAPLVICCDDLHWIDSASRDTLQYLLTTIDHAPVGLVLVSRDSTGAELAGQAARGGHQCAAVTLGSLSPEESRVLAAGLLGGADADGPIGQIVDRANGNPLYIEEMLRILIEQGGVEQGVGGWAFTPQAARLLGRVPGTLRGIMLTRFDRLEPGMRLLLHGLAVVERPCPAELLAQICNGEAEEIERRLVELAERGFLSVHNGADNPRFQLPSSLLRDAIYETLLQRDREYLHRRAAEAIEADPAWPADDKAEATAHHYAESDAASRAIEPLLAAGAVAERRYAADSAVLHYQRALALIQDYPGGRALLGVQARVGLGRALKAGGAFVEAATTLEAALERLLVASVDGPTWRRLYAEALGELADARLREGALERAAQHLEASLRALGDASDPPDRRTWRLLLHRLASVRLRQGNLEQARQLAATATDHDLGEDDPILLANLYAIQGGVCYEQGQLADATRLVERSLEYYSRVGYLPGMASADSNLGALYYAQGRWAMAIKRLERANELRQAIGYLPEQALTLTNTALIRMAMGDHDRAEAELRASVAMSNRLGDGYGLVRGAIGLAHLALILGRYTQASEHLDTASRQLEVAGDDEAVQVRWLQAQVAAHTGDLTTGLALAEEALAMAGAAGHSEQQAECLRILGELHGKLGNWLEAGRLLDAAVDMAIARGDPYQEALALLARGEVAFAQPNPGLPRARSDLSAALAHFRRLGAAWDQARAELALARVP